MPKLKTFDRIDKNILINNAENQEVEAEFRNALALILSGVDVEVAFQQCLTWEFVRYKYSVGYIFIVDAVVRWAVETGIERVPYGIWSNIRMIGYMLTGTDLCLPRNTERLRLSLEARRRHFSDMITHTHSGVRNGDITRNPDLD